MTIHGTFTVTIDAPPETVWPWIGDLDRHAAWSPKPYQVALVSGEANTVGSRYRSIGRIPGDRHHENVVEITDVVPHERLILQATDAMGTFRNSFELRPAGQGTEVAFELAFPPLRGAAAVMVPILFPLIGRVDIRRRGELLKEKVEAGLRPGAVAR